MGTKRAHKKPWQRHQWNCSPSKKHFSISEVAEIFGIEEYTLRYWEKEGGIKPYRFPSGARSYSQADLERIERLQYLVQTKGLTLKAAIGQLNNPAIGTDLEVRTKLLDIRKRLCALSDKLTQALEHE